MLLERFVRDYRKIYNRNVAYNIHSLLHLVDCVRKHGPVDSFSAYKYENPIRKLQFMIRTNINVAQIKRRRADLLHQDPRRRLTLLTHGILVNGQLMGTTCAST